MRILDLATGTGANLRCLAPRIGGRQEWLLADKDARLLARLPAAMSQWAARRGYRLSGGVGPVNVSGPDFHCGFRLLQLDLAGELDRLPLQGHRLVTASALLDLASAAWLGDLVERCRSAGADLLFALTYDGRVELTPRHRGDERITSLVNRHQQTDKGFGPALGPAATDAAQELLASHGYRVLRRSSDWRIGPGERRLQDCLLRGWADAATEMAPASRGELQDWYRARRGILVQGVSRLCVGHQDLLGLRG